METFKVNIEATTLKDIVFGDELCDIVCSKCKNLTDLKGSPKIVDGNFYCISCKKLETLEGAPKVVKGVFNCSLCFNLKDLKGVHETVTGNFYCSFCQNLESLDGVPKKCKTFDCSSCTNLKNLDPLLGCEIGEVRADKELLEDYNRKKDVIQKYGYEEAMEIFNMMEDLL